MRISARNGLAPKVRRSTRTMRGSERRWEDTVQGTAAGPHEALETGERRVGIGGVRGGREDFVEERGEDTPGFGVFGEQLELPVRAKRIAEGERTQERFGPFRGEARREEQVLDRAHGQRC